MEQDGLVNVGEALTGALKDKFGEGAVSVCDKVRKSPAQAYVMIRYDRTPRGFALKGELVLIEPLAQEVCVPARSGGGRYVDALVMKALGVYGKYTLCKAGLERVKGDFVITDADRLTFKTFVKTAGYRPASLVFAKVSDQMRTQLMLGLEWESFFRQGECELNSRVKAWRKQKPSRKGGSTAATAAEKGESNA